MLLTLIVRTLSRIEKELWTSTSSFQLEVSPSSSIQRNSGRKRTPQWKTCHFKEEIISLSLNRQHAFSNLLILAVIVLLRAFLECRVWRIISQGMMHQNRTRPYAYHSMRIIIGLRVISQTKDKYQVNIRKNKNELNRLKMSASPLSCRTNSMDQEEEICRAWRNYRWEWVSIISQWPA